MNARKSLAKMSVLGVAFLSLITLAWGADIQLPLMADKNEPGASGTFTLTDDTLTVQAKGLHPDSVYTVWFVNMKPKMSEAGAGQSPYMFKTDAQGNGAYTASLTESPIGKWQMVMIVLHPNGNPKDMKHMVNALTTSLPKSSS